MILIILHLLLSVSFAEVSFEEFLHLKDALNDAFIELRPDQNHQLMINLPIKDHENYWWDLDLVHASYSVLNNDTQIQHNIFLFGGFARLEEMTLDGLAVTACHELGHGIGGMPYKLSGKSQEGQADYYSTNICLPVVFKYLKQSSHNTEDLYISNFCRNVDDFKYCKRAMSALKSNIYFFSYLGGLTSFEDRSSHSATSLNFSDTYYPSYQCRLDTMVNGIEKRDRPSCWFPVPSLFQNN